MRQHAIVAAVITALAVAPAATTASAAPTPLVVFLEPGADFGAVTRDAEDAEVVRAGAQVLVRVAAGTPGDFLGLPGVRAVEADIRVQRAAAGDPLPPGYHPSDAFVTIDGATWAALPGGSPNTAALWGVQEARMLEAWAATAAPSQPGLGTVIAVIDSGFTALPDVPVSQLWQNPDEIADGKDNDLNGYVDDLRGVALRGATGGATTDLSDLEGHGTTVIATLAALPDAAGPLAGTASGARIMVVVDELLTDTVLGIYYAVDEGADVISISSGYGQCPGDLFYPAETALGEFYGLFGDAVQYAHDHGVTVVVSSGNHATPCGNLAFPASDNRVIAVGAASPQGARASFSDYGAGLDVVAAGEDVVTYDASGTPTVVDGTSYAAPYAAAASAVLLAEYPGRGPADVAYALSLGAVDRDAPGWDAATGYGAIDAARALELMRTTFGDDNGNPHEWRIDWIAYRGVTAGVAPGAYAPAENVPRDQMATFVFRAAAIPTAGSSAPFVDVAPDNPHAGSISALWAAGVVSGTGAGTYAPAQAVRRDEMAVYLSHAFHLAEAPVSFEPFTDDDGNPLETFIERVAFAGITSGAGAGVYNPAGTVRRDEMATFLARAMGYTGP